MNVEFRKSAVLAALVVAVIASVASCTDRDATATDTHCASTTTLTCTKGLVPYSCSGGGRPDEHPVVADQNVAGLVCTDEGALQGGAEGYCCTPQTTSCAYTPAASCGADATGYSCLGSNRPDAFNATISCGQGNSVNGLLTYCCAATLTTGCDSNDNIKCPGGTSGIACSGDSVPVQGDQGTTSTRSESQLLCTIRGATVTGAAAYCCYTPSQPPVGATCVNDQGVANCPSTSFGFACTGPDTPAQDFPRMTCGAGTAGKSTQGYDSTLYCCMYGQ